MYIHYSGKIEEYLPICDFSNSWVLETSEVFRADARMTDWEVPTKNKEQSIPIRQPDQGMKEGIRSPNPSITTERRDYEVTLGNLFRAQEYVKDHVDIVDGFLGLCN